MKKISITTLCVGSILGAIFTLLCIWLWLLVKGNISIIAIVGTIIFAVMVFVCCQLQNRASLRKEKKAHSYKVNKYRSYYYLFGSWMVLKNKGRTLTEYFENHNYKNVAIYGLGRLGICLYEELKGSNIYVEYAIDRNAASFSYMDLKVVHPEDHLKPVDVIVVTKFIDYIDIVDELKKKISCHIVSIEDIVFSM